MSRKNNKTKENDAIINSVVGHQKPHVVWLLSQFRSVELETTKKSTSEIAMQSKDLLSLIYEGMDEAKVFVLSGVPKVFVFDMGDTLIAVLDKYQLSAAAYVYGDCTHFDGKHPSNGYPIVTVANDMLRFNKLVEHSANIPIVNIILKSGEDILKQPDPRQPKTFANELSKFMEEKPEVVEKPSDHVIFVIDRANATRAEMLLDAALITYGKK